MLALMLLANKNTFWGTVVPEWAHRNKWLGSESEIIEVSTVDFSECLKQFGVPYYLKIDIEGRYHDAIIATVNFPRHNEYQPQGQRL